MSKLVKEVLSANQAYAKDFGDKGDLPMPPGRQFRHPDLHGRPPRPGQICRPAPRATPT